MLKLSEVLNDFRMYAEFGADVEVTVASRAQGGETPLHWMATLGDGNGIEILLSAGAGINAVDSLGNSPAHEAVVARQLSALRTLIEHSADLSLKNAAGLTVLELAKQVGFEPALELLNLSTKNS